MRDVSKRLIGKHVTHVIITRIWKELYEIHGSYSDETRVIFQYDGHVSAHITEKDYKKYQQELTFDQLCASLGNLFIDFLYFFNNGESNKIVEILKH